MDVNGQPQDHTQETVGQSADTRIAEPVQPVATADEPTPEAVTPKRSFAESARKYLAWTKYLKFVVVPAAIALVIAAGVYWMTQKVGMETRSLTIGGFSYSFTYNKSATAVLNSNGMSGFQTDVGHSAMVGPVNNMSELCASPDPKYSLAFTVQINGDTRPVCKSQDAQGNQEYAVSFAANNHFHEFVVTDGNTPTATDSQKLQTIFSSIKVTK